MVKAKWSSYQSTHEFKMQWTILLCVIISFVDDNFNTWGRTHEHLQVHKTLSGDTQSMEWNHHMGRIGPYITNVDVKWTNYFVP